MTNKNTKKIISPIAYIKTDFNEKFGIPRQSGRVPSSKGVIVFEKQFQDDNALREIESFSHLWLIFGFHKIEQTTFCPTVRPPRLGGNKKVGVFASRSPFRPNGLGLSCVKLEKIEKTENGCVLIVSGVDILNNSPIYDIKPYLPSVDKIENAVGGYSDNFLSHKLQVNFPSSLLDQIPVEKRQTLIDCLSEDPRPSYKNESYNYGMSFANFNIKFKVKQNVLYVEHLEKI